VNGASDEAQLAGFAGRFFSGPRVYRQQGLSLLSCWWGITGVSPVAALLLTNG
jgi:hypothetical protein